MSNQPLGTMQDFRLQLINTPVRKKVYFPTFISYHKASFFQHYQVHGISLYLTFGKKQGMSLHRSKKIGYPHLQGGPKNRTCLSVDNSAIITRKKACDMSKVLECCRQRKPNLHRNILCLICINLYYPPVSYTHLTLPTNREV